MGRRSKQKERELISVTFGDGPLGVTLRRRPEDGIVFVYEIVEGSQAVDMDINIGDELWAIGLSEIGDVALDKEAWNGLVQYIKFSPRPLTAVWKRRVNIIDGVAAVSPVNSDKTEDALSATSPPRAVVETSEEPLEVPEDVSLKNPQSPMRRESSSAVDDSDYDLQQLSSRMFLKEKEKPSFTNGFASMASKRNSETSAVHLMKPGRKILRMGELGITSKTALAIWASQTKRQFILLTDMLIVASAVGAILQVENMIDLQVCKLFCEGQLSADSSGNSQSNSSDRQDNTFQLIWPGGTLQVTTRSPEEKDNWVENIFVAICDCVEVDSNHVVGWRHQYMLGTMHSAVISRDEGKVKELLAKCESGQLNEAVINSLDTDGYSPLHYACILRLPGIVKVLAASGANCGVEDSRGMTPLHWAALQLDDQALTILSDYAADIDEFDHLGRTPLFLACVEGRDVAGLANSELLSQCIVTLLRHGPDTDFRDEEGYTIMQYLAASWLYGPLKKILYHTSKSNIYNISVTTGMNALHYACDATPLRRTLGVGSWILNNAGNPAFTGIECERDPQRDMSPEELVLGDGVETVKVLLRAGSRPNGRDAQGRTPLQILVENEAVWGKTFGDVVDVMLSYGARIDETPEGLAIKQNPLVSAEESVSEWVALQCVDADELSINKTPHTNFKEDTFEVRILSSGSVDTGKGKTKDSGKDKDSQKDREKICWLCEFKFTLFKRQHHCRLCDCVCCDDCSKKKALVDEAQIRCCDSCFNYLSYETEKRRYNAFAKQQSKQGLNSQSQSPVAGVGSSSSSSTSAAASSSSATQAKQAVAKKDLFGNAVTAVMNAGRDRSDTKTNASASAVSGTMSTMSEAHDRLVERGEKLAKLNDKSADVANAAEEFSKLAKQLNEQQKNRWF